MSRSARVQRTTKESEVAVELELDGSGVVNVETGLPFFDHMLSQLGRHGLLDLSVRTTGDLQVDAHHTVEDTALALGQALREALGDKAGVRRFGHAVVPLDETRVMSAVDLSGRPYLVHTEPEIVELIGTYDTTLTRHIWESLVAEARITLHVEVQAGRNAHHVVEAQFKSVAQALRDAVADRPARAGSPVDEGDAGNVTGRPRVTVLDYGSGNLRSAERALRRAGADVEVTADADAVLDAAGLVVPGVGAFGACMAGLRAVHGPELIGRRLAGARPVLGICVGMQVLFEASAEPSAGAHGPVAGCGEWPGTVERLAAPVLPHMGWNTVQPPADSDAVPRCRERAVLLRPLVRGDAVGADAGRAPAPPGRDLGRARAAVRRRRRERSAQRHSVPPGEVRGCRRAAAAQLADDADLTRVARWPHCRSTGGRSLR